MPHKKYLLLFDTKPVDKTLQDYFNQFDYQIIQKFCFTEINNVLIPPSAILINWTMIPANSTIIDTLFQHYESPIIITSDTMNEDACVQMLMAGADDFMMNPIHPRELHARINAITRRVQRINHPSADKKVDVLVFDNWRLYPTSRQLFNNHKEQLLSSKEYELLLAFLRQPQHVLDRVFLSHVAHWSERDSLDRRIDIQISRLRQKIEVDAKNPILIKAIRNKGYLFTALVKSTKE